MSSRHLSRSIAMQSLYEWDFSDKKLDLKKITERNLREFGPGLGDEGAQSQLTWRLSLQGQCNHAIRLSV